MKKYICILLALVLILPSCTKDVTDDSENKIVFYIDGELPDIGEFSGSKKTEHFHGAYTPDFIPSDDYGEIIPYIGEYKIYSTSGETDWHAEQGYASYGFCTPDGKIVMDASEKNSHINYFERDDGFGYFTVSRNIAQKEDAPDEYYASETLLIPRSGKWCKILNSGSWVSGAGNGVIMTCVYEDGTLKGSVLYDYDGNELLVLDDVDTYGMPSQGLMLVGKWDSGTSKYYFVNMQGEAVLGPYQHAVGFNENGITYVCDYNGEYYFIDTKGNRLTHESYRSVMACVNDRGEHHYIARHKDYTYRGNDILDSGGNIIANIENSSYLTVRFPKNGEILYSDSGGVWKRLSDRSIFKSKEFDVSPGDFYGNDDLYIYKNEADGSAIFFDGDGETVAVLDDMYDYMDISDDGRYMTYMSGNYSYSYDEQLGEGISEDTRKIHIYDTLNKTNIFDLDAAGYASFVGENDRYIMITVYNDDYFLGGGRQYLYDTRTNKMLLESCETIIHTHISGKDYFGACTPNAATLYDGDMNVILRLYNE